MRQILFLLLFAGLVSGGCGHDGVLTSETWRWKDSRWLSGDVKSFQMTVMDTAKVYRLDLELCHAKDYPFQNLYVRTVTTYPSGKAVTSVTSLELAERDGQWSGNCLGKSCEIHLPLQQRFTFPEPGIYTWTIEPYMRLDTIAGIRSLTVLCTEATN